MMPWNFFAFGLGLMLIFLVLGILFFVFWLFMLIDCAKRKFRNDTDKVVWILVIVLIGVIGALVYYFAVKRK